MVINIEIISEEIIKPSSPTPDRLRNLKLSYLDLLAPQVYVPIILFYDHHAMPGRQSIDPFEKSSRLKKSLAETLTRYYPLAGSIKEDFSVDCNDEGVQYYESKASCKLSEVIQNPDTKELHKFLPFGPHGNHIAGLEREVVLAVKVSVLECGGLAIGLCVSHKVGDGSSAITFITDWAASTLAASDEVAVWPSFGAASHFPPPTDLAGFVRSTGTLKDKIVTKRFVFNKSKINALKIEASLGFDSEMKKPTRVEAVSAFIWERFMKIYRSKSTQKAKVFAALNAVNLRPRMNPPLPMHSFANLWRIAIAPSTLDAKKNDYRTLVSKIRNAIMQIDGDYVKKLQNSDEHVCSMMKMSEQFSKGEIEFCQFTSWCGFPVYKVDFGWGNPSWVCSPSRPFKNVVLLMSTKDGVGIEAWVNMVEEDMALFGRDSELLSLVSS